MIKCHVELELKLNHKYEKLKPIYCNSTLEAREELRCIYHKYLDKWGKVDGLLYDTNDIFCFIIDRKNGNEFKARVVEDKKENDKED